MYESISTNETGKHSLLPFPRKVAAVVFVGVILVLVGLATHQAAPQSMAIAGKDLEYVDSTLPSRRLKDPESVGDIINGVRVLSSREYPFMCSLQTIIGGNAHVCGCFIYTQTTVVTTASCLDEGAMGDGFWIYAGGIRMGEFQQARFANEALSHPDFGSGSEINANDIALLYTNIPFTRTSQVMPAVIPDQGEIIQESSLSGWPIATMLGWGTGIDLMQAQVDVFKDSACEDEYGQRFDPTVQICVLGGGIGGCEDDWGGPMLINGKVHGILSWVWFSDLSDRTSCDPSKPSVFTEINQFSSWIQTNARG